MLGNAEGWPGPSADALPLLHTRSVAQLQADCVLRSTHRRALAIRPVFVHQKCRVCAALFLNDCSRVLHGSVLLSFSSG